MEISTSSLRVYDDGLPEGTPIAFEIVGPRLDHPVQGLAHLGRSAPLDLPEGTYQVRITHPELGRLEQTLQLGPHPRLVSFGEPSPAPGAPAPSQLERTVDRFPGRGAFGLRPSGSRGMPPRESGFESSDQDGWIAWWQKMSDGRWVARADVDAARCSAGYIQLKNFGERYGFALQVGGPGRNLSVQVPPMASRLYLGIERGGVSVRFRTDNLEAEALLDYLTAGYMDPARTVRSTLSAEQLLEAKFANPAGAVVGAYFLLRIGEAGDFLGWLERLATSFSELPDGGIAYAWALLSEKSGDDKLSEARAFLLQAAARGMPVYDEGARLLFEGLTAISAETDPSDDDLFPDARKRSPASDTQVATVLARLQPYFRAQKRGLVQTCWRCGESPEPLARTSPEARRRPAHARSLMELPWL